MEERPLVSVVIITYNSAEYVLETLDSALGQTYPNIEIIISDDCSTDNTVSVCQKWINEHKSSGINLRLLEASHNTGTAANNNRGLKAANGKWIKFIAGDDLLMPTCIEDNMEFINNHPEAKVVFSDFVVFSGIKGDYKKKQSDFKVKTEFFFELDAEEQLKCLLYKNILPGPASFIFGETVREYGFNESYMYLEDSPLWIRLTYEGYRMFSFDTPTVLYRHHESLSKSSQRFYSPLFLESDIVYFWSERVHLIKKYNLKDAYLHHRRYFFMCELDDVLFKNKKTALHKVFHKILSWFVSHFVEFKMN